MLALNVAEAGHSLFGSDSDHVDAAGAIIMSEGAIAAVRLLALQVIEFSGTQWGKVSHGKVSSGSPPGFPTQRRPVGMAAWSGRRGVGEPAGERS